MTARAIQPDGDMVLATGLRRPSMEWLNPARSLTSGPQRPARLCRRERTLMIIPRSIHDDTATPLINAPSCDLSRGRRRRRQGKRSTLSSLTADGRRCYCASSPLCDSIGGGATTCCYSYMMPAPSAAAAAATTTATAVSIKWHA